MDRKQCGKAAKIIGVHVYTGITQGQQVDASDNYGRKGVSHQPQKRHVAQPDCRSEAFFRLRQMLQIHLAPNSYFFFAWLFARNTFRVDCAPGHAGGHCGNSTRASASGAWGFTLTVVSLPPLGRAGREEANAQYEASRVSTVSAMRPSPPAARIRWRTTFSDAWKTPQRLTKRRVRHGRERRASYSVKPLSQIQSILLRRKQSCDHHRR